MLMKELIGSCSLEPVAEAAVMSIGPVFFRRVAQVAEREGLSVGAFAARAVRDFATDASASEWNELRAICTRQDMPVLRALHHILESAMEGEEGPTGWRHFGIAAIGGVANHRWC